MNDRWHERPPGGIAREGPTPSSGSGPVGLIDDPVERSRLAAFYRDTLVRDVLPFWLRHGMDSEHGGIFTCLDRDGSLMDSDKSVWFQGRAGWMFATAHRTLGGDPAWLEAARSCVGFSRRHGHSPGGKMWFLVDRQGRPLRMRRYVFSEAFAAIAYAAVSSATGDPELRGAAVETFETYLRHNFEPGLMPPKDEPTRPSKGIAGLMIGIVTAQELRENLGDLKVAGRGLDDWIEGFIQEIERDFLKPDLRALLEVVAPDGSVIEHQDGRTLNPGHAIECAWFILHEARLRNRPDWVDLGVRILDWMWERGWDDGPGGLRYFTDLRGWPVQEYWHDMKFWWPHCEAIIATALAWVMTGEPRFALRHRQVHDWSFRHFPDPVHGEWFGYLHRDGSVSQPAKGNRFKGPFHLPRMLWYCGRLLESAPVGPTSSIRASS